MPHCGICKHCQKRHNYYLPNSKQQYPDILWKEISGFRNILVHNYLGDIDAKTVAAVVEHICPAWKIASKLCLSGIANYAFSPLWYRQRIMADRYRGFTLHELTSIRRNPYMVPSYAGSVIHTIAN